MKERSYGLRTSVVLVFAAGILTGIVQFGNLGLSGDMNAFLLTMFGGIFTSAAVTCLIYSSEYKEIRRKTLWKYRCLQQDFIRKFRKLNYFYPKVPVDLIIRRYYEMQHNKTVDMNRNNIQNWESFSELDDFQYHLQAQEEWTNTLVKSNNPVEEDIVKAYAHWANMQFEETVQEIYDSMDFYIWLSQQNYNEIENAFSEIGFFWDTKSVRKKVYESIHEPIRKMLYSIQQETVHIRLFREGKGNFEVALKRMLVLQDKLTVLEHCDSNGHRGVAVFADFCDKMDHELEDFRAKIIFGQEPEYKKRVPMFTIS